LSRIGQEGGRTAADDMMIDLLQQYRRCAVYTPAREREREREREN